MAILTPALVRLRSDFNTLAPGRDKASDGWIGDAAHRGSVSDHNPDESGNADVRDADRVDEVHAIDVDKDLRHPSVTMQDCVRKILATPADRARLRYVIWNRTIWSASWGWTPRAYTGSNPHTAHAHFSGSYAIAAEANAAPWGIEELIDVTPEELRDKDIWPNGYADAATNPTITFGTFVRNVARDTAELKKSLAALVSRVDALGGAEQRRDAELRVIVGQGLSGELDAADVVRLIGEQLRRPPTVG